jgi:D-glycero-D-manno-heptose 1,7-bisphosphate phosphatase
MVVPRRAVFMDRDGVLNHAIMRQGRPCAPETLQEFAIVDEARLCVGLLKQLGFLLIVVTNQPGVARGTHAASALAEMHAVLRHTLPIDDILVCVHDDDADCRCRKPRPGLLLEAQRRYAIALSSSFLIGDRWKDVDAGHAAGCTTIWIDRRYPERGPIARPDARVPDLIAATRWIHLRSVRHVASR